MYILIKELNIPSNHYKGILSILQNGGGVARVVGGAVRDAIVGKINNDVDIATDLLPDRAEEILSKAGIKVIPTGKKHGTITAFLKDEKFEITTLRKDIDTDGRHARVAFTDDFADDAARRDFTINALGYCPFQHKIYDYFDGIGDLQEKRLVFIGKAIDRIQEDFLRILRFFRFSCYYAKNLDQEGIKACITLKDNLQLLSRERIKWEMDKLILSDNSPDILQEMYNAGILQVIFPINQFKKEPFVNAISIAKDIVSIDLPHRYSLLFRHVNNFTFKELIDLKFSRDEVAKIISIIKLSNEKDINKYILRKDWLENENYLHNLNILVSLGKLDLSTAKQFIKDYSQHQKPIFPCTGHDLQSFNIEGREVGIAIQKLKRVWVESDFTLNKAHLLQILKDND
ncbi:MAG: CCA tRNA nucleotidyltransferase [Rickettsia endosymbiont of Bryobia graminum]|nr:CCA tRNA nucleotidyltransferase [Rickettsia endosymbiont of Bryobia graminum]